MKEIYICQEDHHNKFWSYEIKPNYIVDIEYGRLGSSIKTDH